jgi:hypothetical protein
VDLGSVEASRPTHKLSFAHLLGFLEGWLSFGWW